MNNFLNNWQYIESIPLNTRVLILINDKIIISKCVEKSENVYKMKFNSDDNPDYILTTYSKKNYPRFWQPLPNLPHYE